MSGKVINLDVWKDANPVRVYDAIGRRKDEEIIKREAELQALDESDPDYGRKLMEILAALERCRALGR